MAFFRVRPWCLEELMEADPEDTFYNFAAGIWSEMKRKGDACLVSRSFFILPTWGAKVYSFSGQHPHHRQVLLVV